MHNDPSANKPTQSFQPATSLRFRERPAAGRPHFPRQIAQGDLPFRCFPTMFDLYHVIVFPNEIDEDENNSN